MAMKEVLVKGEIVLIDDEFDERDIGVIIPNEDELEKTKEINQITQEDLLSQTLVDIYGDDNA